MLSLQGRGQLIWLMGRRQATGESYVVMRGEGSDEFRGVRESPKQQWPLKMESKELYYLAPDRFLMSAQLRQISGTPQFDRPKPPFEASFGRFRTAVLVVEREP